jgi:hypothetical protein
MGNNIMQWRAAIGGFGGGIQLICDALGTQDGGDRRKALILLLLLVVVSSVHPNPGPVYKEFTSRQESEYFNSLRSKENKLVRMESHLDFMKMCKQKELIPKGYDFKFHLSTAFGKDKLDLDSELKKSKMSLIHMTIQHYETEIVRLKHEIDRLYENMQMISTEARYDEMRHDLKAFRKSVLNRCKKTKIIKTKKLEKQEKKNKEKESKGNENKGNTSVPGQRLGQWERDILLNGQWLVDEIINPVSLLLRKQYPLVSGLKESAFCHDGFWYNPLEGIQIHCQDSSHWVLTSSIGGVIRVFDSMQTRNVSQDLIRQMNELYSPDDGSVSFEKMSCQQQVGCSDCGLFAAAFAMDLLEGNDVSRIRYDQTQMRRHLLHCLEQGQLTPFPQRRNDADEGGTEKVRRDWEVPR